MAIVTKTFASELENFADTIDIVDDHTADGFWEIAKRYLKNYLNIDFLSLKVETLVNHESALTTVRGKIKEDRTYTLLIDGNPSAQTSYSAFKKKRLWIVESDKGLLSSSVNHLDKWQEGVDDFPKIPEHKGDTVKTSIFLPVERNNRVVAVVECESEEYLVPTDIKKNELIRLAETIYQVYVLSQAYKTGSKNTAKAVRRLELSLQEVPWPGFTRPQMFIATSGSADRKVVGEIRKVLNQFVDRMNVVFWMDISKSGTITKQIIEEISNSNFGLCYFSEPVRDDQEYKYRDNPNVVFEAGMMQALTNLPNAKTTGWIPMREKSSPPVPFDFAGDRILLINRLDQDALNEDDFQVELKNRVDNLLG